MKAIYLRRYTYILIPVFCGPFFYWIFPCTYYNLGKEKKAVTICKYNCIYQTFCITNDPIVILVETQSEEMLVGNMRSHRKLICRFKNLGGVWGFFCFFYTSVYDFRKFLASMVVDSLHKCISATGNKILNIGKNFFLHLSQVARRGYSAPAWVLPAPYTIPYNQNTTRAPALTFIILFLTNSN